MDDVGQRARLRFAQEQMNVLGHDHVSVHEHSEMAAHVFQTGNEEVVSFGGAEVLFAAITTEGDEVSLSGVMIAMQIPRHGERVIDRSTPCSDVEP